MLTKQKKTRPFPPQTKNRHFARTIRMSELKESAVSLDGLRNLIEEDIVSPESEESVDEKVGEGGDLHNCIRISSYKSRTRSARSGGLMGPPRTSMLRGLAHDLRTDSAMSGVGEPRQSR